MADSTSRSEKESHKQMQKWAKEIRDNSRGIGLRVVTRFQVLVTKLLSAMQLGVENEHDKLRWMNAMLEFNNLVVLSEKQGGHESMGG